jgi:gliding motility-associated-like protein
MVGASVAPVTSFAFDTYCGCAPLCIFFENTTVTTTYTTFWQWNFGDGTMSITESPTYCYTTPGIFNVTLTAFDTLGCVDTGYASASIVVTEPPQAQFSISPVSPVSSGTPIQFTDESNGASSWYWMFNDSDTTTSTLQNPSFTYPENGEYLAQLVVTNGSCSDTASIFIQVDIGFTIYVPNAFTPNGNGVNELFRPQGVFWKSEGYRFSVFNRWGEQIFQTNDINAGWDGSYKGSVVQQDTYVWKVIVFDYQGKEHQLIGHVTVLR